MKILLSIDGTDFSRAAVEECCRIIAAPAETSIKIVSVYEVVEPMDISISPEFSRELETSAHQKAKEFADEAAARIREQFPNINLTIEAVNGAPDKILIEEAEAWHPDLIVIAPRGRSFWSRTVFGSVTDVLVHQAPCSVLVARKAKK